MRAAQAEFFADMCAVVFDGSDADGEQLGDIGIGAVFRYHPKHLAFSL